LGAGSSGEPIRTCIGCRAREPISALVRIVADASAPGGCAVDANRDRPGRGAHIHPRAECVEQAQRRRALARALRVSAGGVDIEQVRSPILDARL
jgi:Predicted nucleic-acid-binding protein implicated in transcription termination